MRLGQHPAWCAAGGAVLGGVAALALALAGALPSAPPRVPPVAAAAASTPGQGARTQRPGDGPGAGPGAGSAGWGGGSTSVAEAFLAAWRAHLMASWSVDEVDERTTTSGATLRFDVHEAQSPPDSVLVGNGTVAARRGAVQLACGPGAPGQQYACRSVPDTMTWEEDVDRQVATLRAEVEGPTAYYTVRQAGAGCWSLVLARPSRAVPVVLGRASTFCLDLATGALRSSEVERVGAVDRVMVVAAHAPASATDLALPSGVGGAGG